MHQEHRTSSLRWLLVLAAVVVCTALAMMAADGLLEGEVVLSQRWLFSADREHNGVKALPEVLTQRAEQLRRLAFIVAPDLAGELRLGSGQPADNLGVITASLRSRSSNDQQEQFADYVRYCHEWLGAGAPLFADGVANSLSDPCATIIGAQIQQLQLQAASLQKQLVVSETESNQQQARCLSKSRQLVRTQPPWDDADFEAFAAQQVDEHLAEDKLYESLCDEAADLRYLLGKVDLETAQANTVEELAALNEERERLVDAVRTAEAQARLRRSRRVREIRQELWPQFQQRLERDILALRQQQEASAARLRILGQSLQHTETRLETLQRRLLGDATATATVCLRRPTPALARVDVFGLRQWLLAVAAGGGGGLLASLLSRRSMTLRRSVAEGAMAAVTGNASEATSPEQAEAESPTGWAPKYDHLADQVLALRKEQAQPWVLMASLRATDGSPRLAVNVAISLARRGAKCVLVALDDKSAQLDAVFDLPEGPGWRDNGDVAAEALCHDGGLAGLTIVRSGRQGAADVDAAWTGLREMVKSFDVVLLCGGALLTDDAQIPADADGAIVAGPRGNRRLWRCGARLLAQAEIVMLARA